MAHHGASARRCAVLGEPEARLEPAGGAGDEHGHHRAYCTRVVARRILILLRARLSAQRAEARLPVAALFVHAALAAVLCSLVRDVTPPFAYGVVALSVSAALVSLPLLGELAGLLGVDEAGDWARALPARPHELHVARVLHLLTVLAVLSAGSLLPAAALAPAELGIGGRLALVAAGLAQALSIAAALLVLRSALGGRARPLLVLVQTALFAGVIIALVIGPSRIGALAGARGPHTSGAPDLAAWPPAWFAAVIAPGPLSWSWRWAAPACALAAALALLLVPAAKDSPPSKGRSLLALLLEPLRRLAGRTWVRRGERASFELVYDALPREGEFVIRTYPLVAVPLAFLALGARGEGEGAREGLLALLLFTPGLYLPILVAHVPATASFGARWLLETAPTSPAAIHAGALKAVVVRFVVPLYLLLGALCWAYAGGAAALRLALPAFLATLLVVRFLYPRCVADLPLSSPPDAVRAPQDLGVLLIAMALVLTIVAVLAARLIDSALAALTVSAALLAIELAANRR
jgi:hypothetical protein